MDPDQWRRVNAILQATLARPADERAAFLDQACHGRPDDRGELESLLSHHDEGSDFLESGPGELAAALMMPHPSALAVGHRLAAVAAFSPQHPPAQHRHVVTGADRVAALGAMRWLPDDRYPPRHAVGDDVQKAADAGPDEA